MNIRSLSFFRSRFDFFASGLIFFLPFDLLFFFSVDYDEDLGRSELDRTPEIHVDDFIFAQRSEAWRTNFHLSICSAPFRTCMKWIKIGQMTCVLLNTVFFSSLFFYNILWPAQKGVGRVRNSAKGAPPPLKRWRIPKPGETNPICSFSRFRDFLQRCFSWWCRFCSILGPKCGG